MRVSYNRVNPCYPIYSTPKDMPKKQKEARPAYWKLIHKWDLSEEDRAQLDYYKLQKVAAQELDSHLNYFYGKISRDRVIYIPIYQNCTRNQIKNSFGAYWISYRRYKEHAVALIQPVLTRK